MASGDDLLEKIRRSPNGHKHGDLDRLLLHFGFTKREGSNHTIYRHERLLPGMVVTVPRHRTVRAHVARSAVRAVDLVSEDLDGGES